MQTILIGLLMHACGDNAQVTANVDNLTLNGNVSITGTAGTSTETVGTSTGVMGSGTFKLYEAKPFPGGVTLRWDKIVQPQYGYTILTASQSGITQANIQHLTEGLSAAVTSGDSDTVTIRDRFVNGRTYYARVVAYLGPTLYMSNEVSFTPQAQTEPEIFTVFKTFGEGGFHTQMVKMENGDVVTAATIQQMNMSGLKLIGGLDIAAIVIQPDNKIVFQDILGTVGQDDLLGVYPNQNNGFDVLYRVGNEAMFVCRYTKTEIGYIGCKPIPFTLIGIDLDRYPNFYYEIHSPQFYGGSVFALMGDLLIRIDLNQNNATVVGSHSANARRASITVANGRVTVFPSESNSIHIFNLTEQTKESRVMETDLFVFPMAMDTGEHYIVTSAFVKRGEIKGTKIIRFDHAGKMIGEDTFDGFFTQNSRPVQAKDGGFFIFGSTDIDFSTNLKFDRTLGAYLHCGMASGSCTAVKQNLTPLKYTFNISNQSFKGYSDFKSGIERDRDILIRGVGAAVSYDNGIQFAGTSGSSISSGAFLLSDNKR